MTQPDVITVGLSDKADDKLTELYELGIFREKIDGYRLAIALAISQGVIPPEMEKRKTLYNVGSLDPDKKLKLVVESLMPSEAESSAPYRLIERLAEWGVQELYAQMKDGGLDFEKLLCGDEAKAE